MIAIFFNFLATGIEKKVLSQKKTIHMLKNLKKDLSLQLFKNQGSL